MDSPNIYSDKNFYNLIFINLTIDDKKVVAMFDTGASISIIPESFASELGLVINDPVVGKNNQGKSLNFKKAIIPKLSIGNCELNNLECLVSEDYLFNIQSENGKTFPGKMILGWNVIKDFHWECDLKNKRMYVAPGGKGAVSRSLDYEVFPMIEGIFNNRKLKAGLDTGHTSTMISSKVKGLDYKEEKETEIVGLGTRSKIKVKTVSKFNVFINKGFFTLKNVEVYPEIYGGKELDVLFGADLLEGFRWEMDYKRKYFKIEKV